MSKKIKKEIFHQHIDKNGNVFGSLHPIDAKHKKEKTQKFHDLSIKECVKE